MRDVCKNKSHLILLFDKSISFFDLTEPISAVKPSIIETADGKGSQAMTNAIDKSVKVFSRTVIDDEGTWSRYEYNGSFIYEGNLDDMTQDEMEGFAKMMDCFYEVLFVRERAYALPYTMKDYR